ESNIDEDIQFSEEGISRNNVDLIYKPIRGVSFGKKTIASYYKKYKNQKDNEVTGKKKIQRIVLEGTNSRGRVRLDTEGARLSKYINTKLDENGLVDSNQIFYEYKKFI
ncbi:hypothetical protein, partial [Stenotrophomonas maltophilia group sp. RNC7]|uniref:hypothetical protein n=1 Tax=Stenotrophomonas maltophilia group sp. RNC7 TaxID=3071467 RepID=UPI0027E0625A